jgi:hypothetical protein
LAGPEEKAGKAFWSLTRAAAVFIVGGVVGFATNYWVSYRSDYRSSVETQLSEFSTLNKEVSDNLRYFFEVAEGVRKRDEANIEALRKSLYDSVTEAQTLATRLGNSTDLLRQYQDAAVALQDASGRITGPLDAAPLMKATSDYLTAEGQLRDAAVNSYKSLF